MSDMVLLDMLQSRMAAGSTGVHTTEADAGNALRRIKRTTAGSSELPAVVSLLSVITPAKILISRLCWRLSTRCRVRRAAALLDR